MLRAEKLTGAEGAGALYTGMPFSGKEEETGLDGGGADGAVEFEVVEVEGGADGEAGLDAFM